MHDQTGRHPDGLFLEDVKTAVKEQHVPGSWIGIEGEIISSIIGVKCELRTERCDSCRQ